MSEEELPGLSALAKQLLELERQTTVVPPAAAQDAVFARLTETLSVPVPDLPSLPEVTPGAVGGGKLVAVAVAAFVAGGGAGALGLELLRAPPEPRVEYVKVEVPVPVETKVAEAPREERPPAEERQQQRPKKQVKPAEEQPQNVTITPLPRPEEALEVERTLLERARTALSRGKSEDAKTALLKHQSEFPAGQLLEEREVLMIQALVTEKAFDRARARADAFRKAHPNSILLPTVDAVLETSQ